MSPDLWRMPSPAHVLRCVDQWRALNLRDATTDDHREILLQLRDDFGYLSTQSTKQCPLHLWRVRPDPESEIKVRQDLLDNPHAPPNRCNPEGVRKLYACVEGITALEEARIREKHPGHDGSQIELRRPIRKNDQVCLIKYRPKIPLSLIRVVGEFHPRDEIKNAEIFSEDGLLSYQIMREFFRTEFTKPVCQGTEFLHRLSAAVCEVFFSAQNADGLIYPSVEHPGHDNLALNPEAAKEKLEIQWACIVQVMSTETFHVPARRQDYPGIELELIREATVLDNDVRWEDRRCRMAFMRSGGWVASGVLRPPNGHA